MIQLPRRFSKCIPQYSLPQVRDFIYTYGQWFFLPTLSPTLYKNTDIFSPPYTNCKTPQTGFAKTSQTYTDYYQ